MIKCDSKVVRLSAETLLLLEEYKKNIVNNTYKNNIRKYIEEMNYDKLIRSILLEKFYD